MAILPGLRVNSKSIFVPGAPYFKQWRRMKDAPQYEDTLFTNQNECLERGDNTSWGAGWDGGDVPPVSLALFSNLALSPSNDVCTDPRARRSICSQNDRWGSSIFHTISTSCSQKSLNRWCKTVNAVRFWRMIYFLLNKQFDKKNLSFTLIFVRHVLLNKCLHVHVT